MKIEEGEIRTLHNGKEYVVVNVKNINNQVYVNLVSNFKPLEMIFAKAVELAGKVVLVEITDQEELNTFMQSLC